jgi:hypothetical protein
VGVFKNGLPPITIVIVAAIEPPVIDALMMIAVTALPKIPPVVIAIRSHHRGRLRQSHYRENRCR